jgi:DNA-binding NarL/FixJ family response regulator
MGENDDMMRQLITRALGILPVSRGRVAGSTPSTLPGDMPQSALEQLVFLLARTLVNMGKQWEVRLQELGVEEEAHTTSHRCQLTSRQQEVLTLLYKGMRPSAIAEQLTIREDTVRTHIRDASRRLGTSGGMRAAIQARRLGLLLEQ